jgi:hypothetical protein
MAKRSCKVLSVAVFTVCMLSFAAAQSANADPAKRPPGQASAPAGQTEGSEQAKKGQPGRAASSSPRAQNGASKSQEAPKPDPKHTSPGAQGSRAAQPKAHTSRPGPESARGAAVPAKRAAPGRASR